MCKSVIQTLMSAKFNLRKWQSNCPEILNLINSLNCDDNHFMNLSEALPSKTLGLYWNSNLDILTFSVSICAPKKLTKRHILSVISQIFDPLGLVGPCIVTAKMIIQKIWIYKCGWDDIVPADIQKSFLDFVKSLSHLNKTSIPRWVSSDAAVDIQLHTFSDSSERAYGACVYVRTVDREGQVCVRLLTSKNKISPLKAATIPRLELCGALLGTRLASKVQSSLTIPINNCFYWCDSTIVLAWLSTSPSVLKQFVRNRVGEIQDVTCNSQWSYVPSKQNPADLVSRGVGADQLNVSSLWWSGPEFLQHKEIQYPQIPNLQQNSLPEISLHTQTNNNDKTQNIISILIHKLSSFNKLIRIYSYIQRFVYNTRHKLNKKHGYLSFSDLQTSKYNLIHIAQMEMFPKEYDLLTRKQSLPKNGRLTSLSPFLDSNNLIRVGGRLKNSFYTFDTKHPILLCSKHHLTHLIFEMYHSTLLHGGPQLLLANIRHTYWVLGGRNLAKKILHKCMRCARFRPKYIQPIMADLPTDRTNLEFPFITTGIDYAGPVMIANRKGRGCTLLKSYILICVCFAVKAVHLELVTDLSKEAFLAALARFTARRGKPRCIHADNSTTFVGGFNELNSFLSNNSDAIQSSINEQEIQMEKLQRPAARRRPGSTEGRLTTSTPMAHGTRHCHRTIQRRPCKNCPSQHAKRTITPSISKLVLTT
ncbi:uncharacterized protein LOC105396586 isoform X1 [Plutella xylostella]|uniref:uncharacterized protein LOC105396586 isoform X1 n=1 Tax=Plutella xylostella TaxID=51655 RepID=UPI0020329913|nr:uncharacterized protein LOC105396586 isoform X1 [Plutella xylostella]